MGCIFALVAKARTQVHRSATVCNVKVRLLEKRKTVKLFPAFPQPRLRLGLD